MSDSLLSLAFNDEQFKRLAKEFRHIHNGAPVAMARAINVSLPLVRRGIRDIVSREYNVGKTAVNKTMYVRKASTSELVGKIRSTGYAIPLSKFGMKPKRPGKKTTMANVEIKRGQREAFPFSFVAKMSSGHIGVFSRTNRLKDPPPRPAGVVPRKNPRKKRQIIGQKFGPAIASMLKNPGVYTQVEDLSGHILGYALEDQIERLLAGK